MTNDEKWPGGTVGKGVPAFNRANVERVEHSNREGRMTNEQLNAIREHAGREAEWRDGRTTLRTDDVRALLAHIDALTAERDYFRDAGSELLGDFNALMREVGSALATLRNKGDVEETETALVQALAFGDALADAHSAPTTQDGAA